MAKGDVEKIRRLSFYFTHPNLLSV